MATLLLIVIYIDFIGLGIPDSLFGPAWPAIYPEFSLSVSAASCVTVLSGVFSILCSLLSARIIARFGTPRVTAVSTALTAVGLIGFSFSGSLWWMCLMTLPLGLGAGCIDSALNNYVALHYTATHMSFLHCFYGIGVSLSPYLMSIALGQSNNWRAGYRWAFLIQTVITAITFLSLPLWRRAHPETPNVQTESKSAAVPIRTLFRNPAICAGCLAFFGTCALETTCGNWSSTFLVNARGMNVDDAARLVTLYYVGMAVGRFLSGILVSRLSAWRVLQGGIVAITASIVLMAIPNTVTASIGLFCIGIGNGPVFPNLVHLTPQNFGQEISQSAMGVQMASAYIGSMLMSPLFGLLAQWISADLFPYYLAIMFVLFAISFFSLIRLLRRRGRYSVSPSKA